MEIEPEFVVINEDPVIVQQLLYSVIESDKPQLAERSTDMGDGMSENDSDDDYKESLVEKDSAEVSEKIAETEAQVKDDGQICIITLIPDSGSVAPDQDVTDSYCCPVCQKTFDTNRDLVSHEKKFHAESHLFCSKCNKGFKHQGDLDQHMNVHDVNCPFEYSLCDESFMVKSRKHEKIKHVAEDSPNLASTYFCSVCQKRFHSKAGLKFHEKNFHAEAHIFCPDCNKGFKLLSDLDRHMNVHSGNRPFKCDMCAKSFVSKSSLSQHKKLKHIVGDIFKCGTCFKKFNTEVDILRHSRVHTGEKPFKCDLCTKSFTCKSSLKTHQRVHEGKALKCRFCDMSFYIESDRARHETRHTGLKPYKCENCGNSYSCKSSFSVHFKNVHSVAAAFLNKKEKKQKKEKKHIKVKTSESKTSSKMENMKDSKVKKEAKTGEVFERN